MERTSFLFYADWYDYIKDESNEFRLQMFDTIMKYVFEGIEPSESIRREFKLIRSQLDRDMQKYKDTCKKRTEAINKRWEQYKRNQEDTKVYKGIQEYTNDTNRTDNVNDNDNDNYNDNVNVIKDDNNKKETTIVVPRQKQVLTCDETINFDKLVAYYNSKADGKLPQLVKLTSARRSAINARLQQYSKNDIQTVIDKACASPFLIEHQLGFDWMMRPNNFPKVLEGNYDLRQKTIESHVITGTDWSKQSSNEDKINGRVNELAEYLKEKANGKFNTGHSKADD